MHEYAKKRNGKFLSSKYVNVRTKYKWQCEKGHVWETFPYIIKNGAWCPDCSGRKKLTIEHFHEMAKEKGGKCLSSKFINVRSKLKFQCNKGHIWETLGSLIRQGYWCPKCHVFINEELCRTAFNQIFKCKFKRIRPSWLINSRGNKMELDGFNETLNIAFEYNGKQHFKDIKYFTAGRKNYLENRKKDDQEKIKLCRENNVYLFIFNYNDDVFKIGNLIKSQSKILGINLSKYNLNQKINYDSVYTNDNFFEDLKQIVISKGGLVLSKKYFTAMTPLKFQCGKGHIWKSIPARIKQGGWCPECALIKRGKGRLTIEEMMTLANKRGGKCLSKSYINSTTELKWECEKGHVWEAKPSAIKSGSWCIRCFYGFRPKKLTILDFQNIAKKRNGKCLSEKYINLQTKLKWRCEKGHVWEARPSFIKHGGTWCPECSGKKRLTIENFQEIAKKKGGKCLSNKYINHQTKLKFQCNKGHIWEAAPYNIRSGYWCHECGGQKKITIDEMREIAKNRKGKCLSKVYVNMKTKLKWKCEKGHIWESTPLNVKAGTWCPVCVGKKHTLKIN